MTKIALARKRGRELVADDVIVGRSEFSVDAEVLSILRLVEVDEVYSAKMTTHRKFTVHVIWARRHDVYDVKDMLIENETKYLTVVPALYAQVELEDPRVIEM